MTNRSKRGASDDTATPLYAAGPGSTNGVVGGPVEAPRPRDPRGYLGDPAPGRKPSEKPRSATTGRGRAPQGERA